MTRTEREQRTDLPGELGADYAGPHEHRPLGSYAVLTSTFGTAFTAALLAAGKDKLPERFGVGDILLGGVATYKVSRLIAKDKVTAFARAPFTRFQERSGKGEVEEEARGTGPRYAVGELLVCPYCLSQWISGAYVAGLLHAPRLTRTLGGMYAMYAVADALQIAYLAAAKRS
jgi:hypothetical protein